MAMKNDLFILAGDAMATRFEVALHGCDETYLRSAAEEALAEITRLDRLLSFYRPTSLLAEANREALRRPVKLTPEVFELVQQAMELSQRTDGRFDITVAPLVQLWARHSENSTTPSDGDIAAALGAVGSHHIQLNRDDRTIRFDHPAACINAGSIGKGYALHKAWEILMDLEVPHGLIQGGTSSIIAWGESPEGTPWKIAVQRPESTRAWNPFQLPVESAAVESQNSLEVITLAGTSLSISSIWGRGYYSEGRYLGHVIDPATGWPVDHSQLAAVIHANGAAADALSTAFILAGPESVADLEENFPECQGFIYHNDSTPVRHLNRDPGDDKNTAA